nr:hypothetical protein [Tanacetum cinerariifolium]
KQVEGMSKHKEMYVIYSYIKKIFANMRTIRADFFGVITSLFDTMMVQAPADIERTNDDEIFRVDDLARKEVVMDSAAEPVTTVKDSNAPTTGDKGKAKMIKPEVPLKKKDQMRIDEEYATKLQAEEQEAARLSMDQQDEEGESVRFEQILDFLKSKPIHYALTVNPTIYVACVKQFWATTKVKKVNNQEQIQALVDKTKVIITEDSIRSDLHLDDGEGTACLLNEAIFEGLLCMSTMASAIICLADNQKFNFSKTIRADFFGVITPLFDTMMVQAPANIDEITMAQALATLKSVNPKVVVQEQETSTTIPVVATIVTTAVLTPRANEKVYPLTKNTLHQLWSDVRLQVDYDVEMAYDLLRFIRK